MLRATGLDHTPKAGEQIKLDDGDELTVVRVGRTKSGRPAHYLRAKDVHDQEFLVVYSTYNGRA